MWTRGLCMHRGCFERATVTKDDEGGAEFCEDHSLAIDAEVEAACKRIFAAREDS